MQMYNATIYGLAGHIAGSLSGNNSIVSASFSLANDALTRAQVSSANSPTFMADTLPPTLAGRGYALDEIGQTRYFYPHGSIFSAAAPNA